MSTKLDRPQKKNNKSALLAISGGVDSIVLLNLLGTALGSNDNYTDLSKIEQLINNFVKESKLNKLELVYIDHSQRLDTSLDVSAIEQLAKKFSLKLHIVKLELPKDCSEQLARDKRYEALRNVQKEQRLDHIITAHHANDVLETAIINMVRGTGPKGLSSLRHQLDQLWRPFLYKFQEAIYISKSDILDYAHKHSLKWHEDSTNQSDKYLRNRIRQKLAQQTPEEELELLNLISTNQVLSKEITKMTNLLDATLAVSQTEQVYSTELFKRLPEEVKDQFLHKKISQHGFDVNKESIKRSKEFIQTKTTGKVLQLKGCEVHIPKKGTFGFTSLG